MLPPIPSPSVHDCPNCGISINDARLKFCPQCGAILKKAVSLTTAQVVGVVLLSLGGLLAAGVGACSVSVINGKSELPELGWIGFWPAVVGLLLCLFGLVRILRKK